ncbi:MAG: hypothetical protein RJA49_2257 [Actinomycetota bacterium]
MPHIDLNSDVGEGYGAWAGGPDELLVPLLTSANVACGFHAGDPGTMRRTCELAVANDCVIGAQVSYPDLAGFGRRFVDMQAEDLRDAVLYQLGALDAFAGLLDTEVQYVKPHGALYNAIVHHEVQARAVAEAVGEYDPDLPVLGLPGSAIEAACAVAGLRFVPEGFADRAYTAEGTLVPRTQPDALLSDPDAAAAQALSLVGRGVQSICIHSDTPGAPDLLVAVVEALGTAGWEPRPFVT